MSWDDVRMSTRQIEHLYGRVEQLEQQPYSNLDPQTDFRLEELERRVQQLEDAKGLEKRIQRLERILQRMGAILTIDIEDAASSPKLTYAEAVAGRK